MSEKQCFTFEEIVIHLFDVNGINVYAETEEKAINLMETKINSLISSEFKDNYYIEFYD